MRGVVSSVVKLAEVQIRGSFLYFASQAGRQGGREGGRAQLVVVTEILKLNICHWRRLSTNSENKLPDLDKHSKSSHLGPAVQCEVNDQHVEN